MDNSKELALRVQLLLNFFKLLFKFANKYNPQIKEIENYPKVEELLQQNETLDTLIKRCKITTKILKGQSANKEEKNITKVLQFTENILSQEDFYSSITKLNLLVNNSITLMKLITEDKNKDENLIMTDYLANIIRNFNSAYANTFASLFVIISQNVAIINSINPFFDYEKFFENEDKYLNEQIVPKLKEETNKLGFLYLGEECFSKEFELDTINYESDLDLLYYINVLYEMDGLKKYKNTYEKEKYLEYKAQILKKLKDERIKNQENSK